MDHKRSTVLREKDREEIYVYDITHLSIKKFDIK